MIIPKHPLGTQLLKKHSFVCLKINRRHHKQQTQADIEYI
jgi:hypothetical protein